MDRLKHHLEKIKLRRSILILSIFLLFSVAGMILYFISKDSSKDLILLGRNCGTETVQLNRGYDISIRECMFESFKSCSTAYAVKKGFTDNGEQRDTTLQIDKQNDKCEIRVYNDNTKDLVNSSESKREYKCYKMNLVDMNKDEKYLAMGDCGLGDKSPVF